MKKGVLLILFFIILIPAAFSITLKDLINFFNFNFFTNKINVTNSSDFMMDKDSNNINDTLIIELTTSGNSGDYLFIVNLFDENIITNETNKTLNSGVSKFNISFPTESLSKNRFNYTIKIYEGNYSLKYSKENIETQFYNNYETGLKIINITDKSIDSNFLQLNITVNFTKIGFYEITAYLGYNSSIIFSKTNGTISSGISNVLMNFSNETIKNTNYIGNFNLTNIKINNKIIKINYTTNFYDYKDFAKTSYFIEFSDYATDANNNGLYDLLIINATMEIKENATYNIDLALYDLFDVFIYQLNKTQNFIAGKNNLLLQINGTDVYTKKLNAPYIVKYAKLIQNSNIIEQLNDFYATRAYNYTDFEKPSLPDINLTIKISDGYLYGQNNVTINVSIRNIGTKTAFNAFLEFFDNNTYSRNESITILIKNKSIIYSIDLINISDTEFNAIADFDDFIEELNDSNNIIREVIKINKKPELKNINRIVANETDLIKITANATDNNSDVLTYAINDSKFSKNNNNFSWKTTTMDSGNYTIMINASDGYLHDSTVFSVIVLDKIELDSDNDGINDTLDKIIGEPSLINTSTINISFFIGNSSNLSKEFQGKEKVEFKDNSLTIVEFDFNFTNSTINLNNIIINKQDDNSTGALVFSFRNITLPKGFTKTIYLDRLNASKNSVCLKDMEIRLISEISNNCDGLNEFKVECDGTLQNNYNCSYINAAGKYRISGLNHSGLKQIEFSRAAESSSSSSASSNGGGGSSSSSALCAENWQCTEWTECINNVQSRICEDFNKCGTITSKPIETRECLTLSILENPNAEQLPKDQEDINQVIENARNKIPSVSSITGFSIALQDKANPKTGALVVFFTVLFGLFGYISFFRA